MKYLKACFIFLMCVTTWGCQSNTKSQTSAADSTLFKDTTPLPEKDPRPAAEVAFLNKVKAESDYDIASDAIKKDTHIEAFNKYALDSLKKISAWEMIVAEINDDELSSNSVMSKIGLAGPIYNVKLTAPIKLDKSVDSIAIDNRVDFTITILKKPNGEVLKQQLAVIKTLKKGDVVIVSGALTHFDDDAKVNFASFYEQYSPWNIDLLLTDLSKSKTNNYTYLRKIGY
jgi:hypothetical protein